MAHSRRLRADQLDVRRHAWGKVIRRKEVKNVNYIKPAFYEEAMDINATTPVFVAIVAIIVIIAEVIANVAE